MSYQNLGEIKPDAKFLHRFAALSAMDNLNTTFRDPKLNKFYIT